MKFFVECEERWQMVTLIALAEELGFDSNSKCTEDNFSRYKYFSFDSNPSNGGYILNAYRSRKDLRHEGFDVEYNFIVIATNPKAYMKKYVPEEVQLDTVYKAVFDDNKIKIGCLVFDMNIVEKLVAAKKRYMESMK